MVKIKNPQQLREKFTTNIKFFIIIPHNYKKSIAQKG